MLLGQNVRERGGESTKNKLLFLFFLSANLPIIAFARSLPANNRVESQHEVQSRLIGHFRVILSYFFKAGISTKSFL